MSPEGDSGDLAFSQHAEEAGEEDYHLQVRPYPVQQDHVSTYGAGNEEYGRPDFESQFELGEMKRVLVSQHDGSQVLMPIVTTTL